MPLEPTRSVMRRCRRQAATEAPRSVWGLARGCAIGMSVVLSVGPVSGQAVRGGSRPIDHGTIVWLRAVAGFEREAARAPGSVLRHLPRRPPQDRQPVAAGTRSREGGRSGGSVGESDPQAARRRDAAARHPAPAAARLRSAARLAGERDRSCGGDENGAGVGGPAPAEPHGVRERHSRPARSADRRDDASAAGRFGQRVRQHCRIAHDLANAARVVHDGGGARRPHGDRFLEIAVRSDVCHGERCLAEPASRRHAVRHARRHRRAAHVSGRRRVQVLDPELRRRQLHSRRAAGADHRRRARARLAIPRRRARRRDDGGNRRHARNHRARARRIAAGRRDVPRDELSAQPRHHPPVRSQVAREQHDPADAELPGHRLRAHPGSVQRRACR